MSIDLDFNVINKCKYQPVEKRKNEINHQQLKKINLEKFAS
jgi:hypothetical protein